jgi:inosine/guanosine/xanthosine phosphorylase family protein
MQDLVTELKAALQAKLKDFAPKVGMILGSGLGDLVKRMEIVVRIPYIECKGLFVSTVPGHKGEFVFGFLEGAPVMCMNGRVHLYEGAAREQLITPIRLMKLLGCASMVLTNAAGSLHSDWLPGTLVLIKDQINFTGISILAGANREEYGPRFVSMEHAYDPKLRQIFRHEAAAVNLTLKEGVYLGVMGPQYETPAEIKMFAQLGGDIVGMSTIHEVIAARHVGLKVVGLTLVTNLAAGLSDVAVNHEEVIATAKIAGGKLQDLIQYVFKKYAQELTEHS